MYQYIYEFRVWINTKVFIPILERSGDCSFRNTRFIFHILTYFSLLVYRIRNDRVLGQLRVFHRQLMYDITSYVFIHTPFVYHLQIYSSIYTQYIQHIQIRLCIYSIYKCQSPRNLQESKVAIEYATIGSYGDYAHLSKFFFNNILHSQSSSKLPFEGFRSFLKKFAICTAQFAIFLPCTSTLASGIHTHTRTNMGTYTHAYTHMHTRTHKHAHAQVHTHIHTHTHAHTHPHTHAHTSRHKHTRTNTTCSTPSNLNVLFTSAARIHIHTPRHKYTHTHKHPHPHTLTHTLPAPHRPTWKTPCPLRVYWRLEFPCNSLAPRRQGSMHWYLYGQCVLQWGARFPPHTANSRRTARLMRAPVWVYVCERERVYVYVHYS